MPGTKNKSLNRIVSVSVTGPYHKQKGLKCQDFCIWRQKGKKIVAVVADGAGSVKYGRLGAKYVCEALCRILCSRSFKSVRQNIIDAIEIARDQLVCHRLNRLKNEDGLIDFSATVVGMVYDGSKGVFFHIGDGAGIALRQQEKRKYIVSEPENGIFSSETFFFTMEDWKDSLRFTPFEKAQSVFLMTDGVTSFALKKDMRTIEDGFIVPIDSFLKNQKDIRRASKALKNTLETKKASTLNGDDKTLMWIEIK